MNEHIIFSYILDERGGGKQVNTKNYANQKIESKNLMWFHLDVNNPETKNFLKREVSYLDPFIIDGLLADETRSRFLQTDDGIMLILRGVNINKDADPEDMVSIRVWINKYHIITLGKFQIKAISDIEQKIKIGKGPRNLGDLICMLMSELFEDIEPVLNKLEDQILSIEERVLETLDASLKEDIGDIRKQIITFQRYIEPQESAVKQLYISDLKWLNKTHRHYIQESYNNLTRYIENLNNIQERSQVIKDELTSILTNKLNKNMYFLSVITAIFLPLTFLTGLLGINVNGIPGASSPYAFAVFCGLLVLMVTMQIIIFKKLKLF